MATLHENFPHIILASRSPRRSDLLRQIGLQFQVQPSDVVEPEITDIQPATAVQEIALTKARAVAAKFDTGLVIGADTTVVSTQKAMSKPENYTHAIEMLKHLSGNRHEVITGVALIDLDRGREIVWSETTTVYFRKLHPSEIVEYVDSGEADDKAGAYGIQGKAASFVERIEGCYFNVVGLPLASLVLRLWDLGKIEKRIIC